MVAATLNAVLWILLLIGACAAAAQFFVTLSALWYMRSTYPQNLRPFYEAQAARNWSKKWPEAVVIVPCKGVPQEFAGHVETMRTQDYPSYELVYVTESADDPAAEALAAMASDGARFHHVVAGLAAHCCQKNHNLLRAIDYVREQGIPADVYVFADADMYPRSNWLANLVLPLADRGVFAATGFRSLVTDNPRFVNHLHALLSAYQAMAMPYSVYAGIWGGSMALTRAAFEEYGVYDLWSKAMVDDLVLTWLVRRHGLKRVFAPDCFVYSADTHEHACDAVRWFARQCQYAANYLFPSAVFGAVVGTVLAADAMLLPVTAALFALGLCGWPVTVFHVGVYLWVMLTVGLLSAFNTKQQWRPRWLLYTPVFLVLGCWAAWRGLFSKRMVWAGVIYEVDGHGHVVSITRPDGDSS